MRHSSVTILAALAVLVAAPVLAQGRLAAPAAFPNPHAEGPLTIRYVAGGTAEVPALEVFDLLGRHLDPGAPLAAGVYFYRLRYADGRVSEAGRLTQLTGGPLDVQLLPGASEPAFVEVTAGATAASTLTAEATEAGAPCADGPVWVGLRHAPLGNAQIMVVPGDGDTDGDDFLVFNIGSSREDGVRTCLGNTAGAGVDFDALDLMQEGVFFGWDLDNDRLSSNGILAHASFQEADGLVNTVVDLSGLGATSLTLDVWEHGVLVYSEAIPQGTVTFVLEQIGGGGVVLSEASTWKVEEGIEVRDDGGIVLAEASTHAVPQIEGALGVVSAAASTGAGFRNRLLNFPTEELFGNYNFTSNIVFDTSTKRVTGDRLVVRATVPGGALLTESRMRFANSADVLMESVSLNVMGHFHSAVDVVDYISSSFLLKAVFPDGPLAVTCLPGGCPETMGVEVLATEEGSERLHVELKPHLIPRGGSGLLEVGLGWAAEALPTEHVLLNLTIQSVPGGVILRMDKENCDEVAGPDECQATFEFYRDGQVVLTRTVPHGVAVLFPGSLTVHSAEVAWFMPEMDLGFHLGVTGRFDVDEIRVLGKGPLPGVLGGMTLLSSKPLTITEEWGCPGDPFRCTSPSALHVMAPEEAFEVELLDE